MGWREDKGPSLPETLNKFGMPHLFCFASSLLRRSYDWTALRSIGTAVLKRRLLKFIDRFVHNLAQICVREFFLHRFWAHILLLRKGRWWTMYPPVDRLASRSTLWSVFLTFSHAHTPSYILLSWCQRVSFPRVCIFSYYQSLKIRMAVYKC